MKCSKSMLQIYLGVMYHNLQGQLLSVCHIYAEHSMLRPHRNFAKRIKTFKLRIFNAMHLMLSAGHWT